MLKRTHARTTAPSHVFLYARSLASSRVHARVHHHPLIYAHIYELHCRTLTLLWQIRALHPRVAASRTLLLIRSPTMRRTASAMRSSQALIAKITKGYFTMS